MRVWLFTVGLGKPDTTQLPTFTLTWHWRIHHAGLQLKCAGNDFCDEMQRFVINDMMTIAIMMEVLKSKSTVYIHKYCQAVFSTPQCYDDIYTHYVCMINRCVLQIYPHEKSITLVICPLSSLMWDQRKSWDERGLKCAVICERSKMTKSDIRGMCFVYSFIFFSTHTLSLSITHTHTNAHTAFNYDRQSRATITRTVNSLI